MKRAERRCNLEWTGRDLVDGVALRAIGSSEEPTALLAWRSGNRKSRHHRQRKECRRRSLNHSNRPSTEWKVLPVPQPARPPR